MHIPPSSPFIPLESSYQLFLDDANSSLEKEIDQQISLALKVLLKKMELKPDNFTPDFVLSLCSELDAILVELSNSKSGKLFCVNHFRAIRARYNQFELDNKPLTHLFGRFIEFLNTFPDDLLCIEQKARYFCALGLLEEIEEGNLLKEEDYHPQIHYYGKALEYAKESNLVAVLRERLTHILNSILIKSTRFLFNSTFEPKIQDISSTIFPEDSFVEVIRLAFKDYQVNFKKNINILYQEVFQSDQNLNSGSVRAFQKDFFKEFQQFFQKTLLQGPTLLLEPEQMPPHDLLAMGSLGREEPTPYSDLECFLLVKHERDLPFFHRFAYLLELEMIAIGETPVGEMIGLSSEATRKGFYLDKCQDVETPFMISTTHQLASWQSTSRFPSVASYKREAYSFYCSQSLHSNDSSIYEDYCLAMRKQMEGSLQQDRAFHLLTNLVENYEDAFLTPPTHCALVDIKIRFMIPLYYTIAYLGFYHKIDKTNTLDLIKALAARGVFKDQTEHLLEQLVAAIYLIRCRIQCEARIPTDKALLDPTDLKSDDLPVLTSSEKTWLIACYEKALHPLYHVVKRGKEALESIDLSPK